MADGPAHRLRFDELLCELGARDPAETGPGDRPEHVSGQELIDKAAESGFGFLIGVLTLVAIPMVGLSTPFGLVMALIGAQMIVGRGQPWLPARVRRRTIPSTMLDRVLVLLRTRARWLATTTRRRWSLFLMPRLVGVSIVFLALAWALPLPIPGSNIVFMIPLFVYAIALLERDGVWIAVAHVMTLADAVLLIVFGKTVLLVLDKVWHWVF